MNLHCGLGDWKSRMDTVVGKIIELNPDVIGLQEVCYNSKLNMTTYLLESLKKNGYPVKFWKTTDTHRSFVHYQEQLLIISKKEVLNSLEAALPSVPSLENRILAIELREGWAITTHLHFAIPLIRKNQYKKISDMFSNKNAIIFGDMNSNPDNYETKLFHEEGWISFFPGATYPSDKPSKIFDGFWASQGFSSQIASSSSEIIFEGHDPQPSDHLGVFLKLILR